MDKFFNFSAAVVSIAALVALITVPWLVILATPVILVLSAPAAFIAFLVHRKLYARRSKLQVLVVDDEPFTVSPLLLALSNPDMEVNIVTNGHQMLTELREKSFDLMFLDRYMPDMDGDQALMAGDQDPYLQKNNVPVIFFTSSADGLALQEYNKFRVRDIWHKGISLSEIRNRVQNVMTEIVA